MKFLIFGVKNHLSMDFDCFTSNGIHTFIFFVYKILVYLKENERGANLFT